MGENGEEKDAWKKLLERECLFRTSTVLQWAKTVKRETLGRSSWSVKVYCKRAASCQDRPLTVDGVLMIRSNFSTPPICVWTMPHHSLTHATDADIHDLYAVTWYSVLLQWFNKALFVNNTTQLSMNHLCVLTIFCTRARDETTALYNNSELWCNVYWLYYPSMWYSTARSGSPQDALHLH